jgi:hypothetical protein
VLNNLRHFSFLIIGFSRLKMSKKKKNDWTIFRTQQEFAVGINSSYQSVPKTAKVLA